MRTVMANLWHPLGGIPITEVGEKRFVFQFYCEIDFDRVVNGTPWTFNNHLLVFNHLKHGEDPLEVDLLFTEFWIQIHNLPPGMFTSIIAKQFGDFIGHSENCCPKRLLEGKKELPLEWDISLRAPPRRGAAAGMDLGYNGRWYMWERENFGINNIRELLDSGVANRAWSEIFPSYDLTNIDNSILDHCPLLLDTDLSIGSGNSSRLGGQFQFETAWLLEDSCFEQVKTLSDSNKNVTVPERLNMMGKGLKMWISRLKKERGEVMEILTRRLRNLTAEEPSDEIIEATIQTKLELNLEMDKE
ncbi:hypothetical protein Godav_028817 [Gossypium davidsonii]|uniref:DUF4283 domain-containing protein n=1 Tax=Gossypium davidsonii TaxID=34287 RepID=A0A7J8T9M8_GOSDV|nr:hypothetical protein [Gossypium davidsonii]